MTRTDSTLRVTRNVNPHNAIINVKVKLSVAFHFD